MTAPEPRSARAHVLVCEQFDGNSLVFPIVSPDLASYDSEEAALAAQSLFLREYMARSPPEVIARLSLPEGSRLHEAAVALPREDLPRRLQSDTRLTFASVVIPAGKDAWVIIPKLNHTFYVDHGEVLDDAIRDEVRRIVSAQELTPWEQVGLLPARDHRIEVLEIPLSDEGHGAGRGAQLRKAIAERARRKQAVAALHAVSTPLHVTAKGDKPPPLVGREAESALLASLLDGEERLSVLLIGSEHAGKSALLRGYLGRSGRLVYATSGAQLIAGMSGLGQWQERIQQVMEAAGALDAVLYFENVEDLLAERTEDGGIDLSGAMRPYIDEGRVRLLAEIRPESLDALEGRHWALFANLSRIKVNPLSPKEALTALSLRAEHDARAEPHKPRVAPDALPALVDLAERYLPYGTFPGKAIRLYEDLRATREKDHSGSGPASIGRRELYEMFSLTTGVPEFLLRDDQTLRIEDVASALMKQIIGQERAVMALSETVGVVKAGLQPLGKPLATFLFVGPTGVGKTELARALAEFLFGSPDRMVRFDMSEFMSPDAAERLIRGTDRADGLLTRKVREQPFCVLLLDEIEKAHPAVFDLLLQVCGEGRLTDARGKTAFFHNAILIMTSNLGAAERRTQAGFTAAATPDEAQHYQKLVNASFRQEFVNRLDRIVPFRALTRAEVEEVARLAVAKIKRRRGLDEAGVTLSVSDAALSRFAEEGFSEAYGARALRRHMDEHLASPLGRLLSRLGGEAKELFIDVTLANEPEERREGLVVASLSLGSFRFQIRRRKSLRSSQQVYGFDEISTLRRQVDGWMRLSPVEQLKDQLEFLVTQLNLASKSKVDRRRTWEVAELQAEHYRLQEIWEKLSKAAEEVNAVEELSIMALFEGQEVLPFLPDARAAHTGFCRALPYALVALEPRRDEVTLIVEELDEGALDGWLEPLLRMLESRGFSATVHVDGGERLPDDNWPADRRWGPPRSAAWLLTEIGKPKRSFRSLLLRCKGPYAGVFLALEAGLHRIVFPRRAEGKGAEDDRAHIYVHLVALKADVANDAWGHKSLAPPQVGTAGQRRRGAAARELDRVQRIVLIAGRRRRLDIDPGEYWARQEEIALEHLLLFEQEENGLDRDDYFAPPVEDE